MIHHVVLIHHVVKTYLVVMIHHVVMISCPLLLAVLGAAMPVIERLGLSAAGPIYILLIQKMYFCELTHCSKQTTTGRTTFASQKCESQKFPNFTS